MRSINWEKRSVCVGRIEARERGRAAAERVRDATPAGARCRRRRAAAPLPRAPSAAARRGAGDALAAQPQREAALTSEFPLPFRTV